MNVTKGSILQRLQDLLGTQTTTGIIPVGIANQIQTVVEIGNRTSTFVKWGNATVTTTLVVFTTSATVNTYLTAIHLSLTKDVTCDMTSCYLELRTEEGLIPLVQLPLQSLTASSITMDLSLPYPIKLAKSAQIRLLGPFAAGTANKTVALFGYEVE